MTRAIALSLAESDKSSNKNSKKNNTSDTQESNLSTTINPPPGLKKKQSCNLNEPQEPNSLTVVPEPPPGFKKKKSTYTTEMDFPVMIKAPESLPSAPSLSYSKLIGSNVSKQEFPTLCGNPTVENKPVAPPPGFGKKTPSSCSSKPPQPEKKEPFVKQLRHVLKSDENFEQFKIWSSQYRRSEISAEEYENNCYKLFGDQQWNNIFDELVATFPDKQGRDDLIKAHHDHGTKKSKKYKAKKHHHDNNDRPLTAWGIGSNMLGDRMNEDLYPPLSSTSMVQPPPAKWGRKVAVK